jgi:hypothetical protein
MRLAFGAHCRHVPGFSGECQGLARVWKGVMYAKCQPCAVCMAVCKHLLQARSRLHVRRPGSCQLHVFCYWLQVMCRLTVGCCHRQGSGCTREASASLHINQMVLHACIADLALMSLHLCAINVLFATVLHQCQLYQLGGVMFSTLPALVNAK